MGSICKYLSSRSKGLKKWHYQALSTNPYIFGLCPQFYATVQGKKRFTLGTFSEKERLRIQLKTAMCLLLLMQKVSIFLLLLNEPYSATDLRGNENLTLLICA